jgi:hypothetical protein
VDAAIRFEAGPGEEVGRKRRGSLPLRLTSEPCLFLSVAFVRGDQGSQSSQRDLLDMRQSSPGLVPFIFPSPVILYWAHPWIRITIARRFGPIFLGWTLLPTPPVWHWLSFDRLSVACRGPLADEIRTPRRQKLARDSHRKAPTNTDWCWSSRGWATTVLLPDPNNTIAHTRR